MSGYYGAPKRSAPAPLSLGVTNTSSTMMSSGSFAKRHRRESTTSPTPLSPAMIGGASFTNSGSFIHDDSIHDDATAADRSPRGRGSRHIPTREAMDWAVAAYNLNESFDVNQSQQQPNTHGTRSGHASNAGSHANSFSNDASHSSGSLVNHIDSHNSQRIGHRLGDGILRFGRERRVAGTPTTGGSMRSTPTFPHGSASGGSGAVNARVLSHKPVRVLDAPNVSASRQVIDWNDGNKLAVGLRNQIFVWDGDTKTAEELATLQDDASVSIVHWLSSGAYLLVALDHGPMSIFNVEQNKFMKTLRVGGGFQGDVTAATASGPIIAAATNGARENIHIFDVRVKNSLIRTFDAHDGPAKSIVYCDSEPFYLASGGDDGAVHVWDVRKPVSIARYTFPEVTRSRRGGCSPITALRWNANKRSELFVGSADGMLRQLDTHAKSTMCVFAEAFTGSTVVSIISRYGAREVMTANVGTYRSSDDIGGHLQLRRVDRGLTLAANFHTTQGHPLGAACLSLDGSTVCATQMNHESLDFWDVNFWDAFDKRSPQSKVGGGSFLSDNSVLNDTLR
jgi:WD40 repeat protein